jgi:hypothetical protein
VRPWKLSENEVGRLRTGFEKNIAYTLSLCYPAYKEVENVITYKKPFKLLINKSLGKDELMGYLPEHGNAVAE